MEIEDYKNLIVSQYQNSSKFMAWLEDNLGYLDNLKTLYYDSFTRTYSGFVNLVPETAVSSVVGSFVNGNAFITLSGLDLTNYIGHRITITDSNGKKAIGWIKEQGTGETKSSELIYNGTFETSPPFFPTYIDGWIQGLNSSFTKVSGGITGYCGKLSYPSASDLRAYTNTANPVSTPIGGLFELKGYLKKGDSNTLVAKIGIGPNASHINNLWGETSQITTDATWQEAIVRSNSNIAESGIKLIDISGLSKAVLFDNISLKQILTPDVDGYFITNSYNGVDNNWENIDVDFNFNDTYTYQIDKYYIRDYIGLFGIDGAVGNQLDILGVLIGQSRILDFIPTGYSTSILLDEDYRVLLKAKIIKNHWKGQIQNLYDLWNELFPGSQIVIIDNQDMTMDVGIYGNLTATIVDLITNGYIIPKPIGVGINFYFGTLPVFGFGIDNAYISGFGIGNWADYSLITSP